MGATFFLREKIVSLDHDSRPQSIMQGATEEQLEVAGHFRSQERRVMNTCLSVPPAHILPSHTVQDLSPKSGVAHFQAASFQ